MAGPSAKTKALWCELEKLCAEELQKGIMDVDPHVPSTITAFGPGYIDRPKEVIVGLQTDAPLKRAIKPLGGINMVKAALQVRECAPLIQPHHMPCQGPLHYYCWALTIAAPEANQ